jgi:hypothetical protein
MKKLNKILLIVGLFFTLFNISVYAANCEHKYGKKYIECTWTCPSLSMETSAKDCRNSGKAKQTLRTKQKCIKCGHIEILSTESSLGSCEGQDV